MCVEPSRSIEVPSCVPIRSFASCADMYGPSKYVSGCLSSNCMAANRPMPIDLPFSSVISDGLT